MECQIHDVDAVIARGLIGLLIFVLAKAARGHVRKFTVSSALVESFHGTTSISHFLGEQFSAQAAADLNPTVRLNEAFQKPQGDQRQCRVIHTLNNFLHG